MAVESTEVKLFGKWSYSDVVVEDITLRDYIALDKRAKVYTPHTAGRYQKKRFHKALCPIVERLMCSVMGKGRNNGKKTTALRIVEQTLDVIHLVTGANPIQVVVQAVQNGGAREDSTRIGSGGVVRRQAVDVAPIRRVNTAIGLICTGARNSAFRNVKSLAECLADELINCSGINSNGVPSANSFAIKKKDEVERVAKANR